MIEGWIKNGDVRIHYFDNTGSSASATPLVIIPGLAETGEEYEDLIQALLPRRAIVITMRGRGRSDTPESGYTLEDHVSDIEKVMDHITVDKFAMFGYGRGVAYALAYALSHLSNIKGLIIGDYPAMQTDHPEGWTEFFKSASKNRLLDNMDADTLKEIEKDAREVDFIKHLKKIDCPVLVLQGSGEYGLTEEGAKDYLRAMPDARVKVLDSEQSAVPTSPEFAETLEGFFKATRDCT